MKRTFRSIAFYLAMIAAIVAIYSLTSGSGQKEQKSIYSDLIIKIQQGDVAELSVVDNVATVKLNDGTSMEVEVPGYYALKEDAGTAMHTAVTKLCNYLYSNKSKA